MQHRCYRPQHHRRARDQPNDSQGRDLLNIHELESGAPIMHGKLFSRIGRLSLP